MNQKRQKYEMTRRDNQQRKTEITLRKLPGITDNFTVEVSKASGYEPIFGGSCVFTFLSCRPS